MKSHNIEYQDCHSIGTIIHVAIDGKYEGHIVISDVVKEDSKEAIAKLKSIGVGAFNNCSSVSSIIFPSGLTEITERSFNRCENLQSIDLSNKYNLYRQNYCGCIYSRKDDNNE